MNLLFPSSIVVVISNVMKSALSGNLLVFTVGRSGSTYLRHLLLNHAGVNLGECFSRDFHGLGDETTIETKKHYLLSLSNALGQQGKRVAYKITPHVWNSFWNECTKEIECVLDKSADCNSVLLYRHDFWGLCLSFWLANKTGVWHSTQSPSGSIKDVDFVDVAKGVRVRERRIFELYDKFREPRKSFSFAYESLQASPLCFSLDFLNMSCDYEYQLSDVMLDGTPQKLANHTDPKTRELISQISGAQLKEFTAIRSDRDAWLKEVYSRF